MYVLRKYETINMMDTCSQFELPKRYRIPLLNSSAYRDTSFDEWTFNISYNIIFHLSGISRMERKYADHLG